MKGRRVMIAVAASLICCCTGLTEIGSSDQDEDVWTGPGASISEEGRTVCHVSGIDYPDGYDWSSAVSEENVRCSLVVLADGVPKLKLPVGKGHEVSADPDMHWLTEGHLYTVFCSDGYTSIKKDGKGFIRYEGSESIRGMVIVDEDIYTLGIPLSGKGFTYRKNGELILERRTGYAFERLNLDSGRICFAFCQSVTVSDGTVDRYYIVRDGRTSLLDFSEETTQVWDIMSHQGKACAITSAGPWSSMELIMDEERKVIGLPYGSEMISCRMFSSGEDLCVEGRYFYRDGRSASGLWVEGEEYMLFETGQSVSAVCASKEDVCCILNPDFNNPEGIIFQNGKTFSMPSGYTCTGNSPAVINEGDLYVGLTSTDGGLPLLWKNGSTDTLRINGPLCSLSVSRSDGK